MNPASFGDDAGMLSFRYFDAGAESVMELEDAKVAGPVALRRVGQGWVQAVHVEATIAIVAKQELILS